MNKKYMFHSISLLGFILIFCFALKMNLFAGRELVIVIDPGHGGSNLGAEYNGITEKEANLQVAAAMKTELEKYEGVVVYVTRSSDTDMDLVQRAAFARSVNADLILSLHFNMSEHHDLHGSEMWISSQGALKTEAERFARIELKLLEEYGIETRGCFTRMNENGEDYYGIIRESAKFNIPTVIIEHCYLDRMEEAIFYDSNEDLEILGRIDATAVAMSYGLASEKLGVNYRGHRLYETKLPDSIFTVDTTPPSKAEISIVYFDSSNFELTLNIKVKDEESSVVYYEYSFNNGRSFMRPEQVGIREDFDVKLFTYAMNDNDLIIRAYNAYGLYTDSNCLALNELLFHQYKTFPDDLTEQITTVFNEEDAADPLLSELSPEAKYAYTIVGVLGGALGFCIAVFLGITHLKNTKNAIQIRNNQRSA